MTDDQIIEARARALNWQETHIDRGDGSSELSGWEADSGFGCWYSIEMYFASDSYGWSVKFDCELIADTDDPDTAKAAAQADFERRVRATLAADKAAGYWLAPMEATPAMSLAFHEGERYGFKTFGQRYCAMRDAALRARQTQEGT